MYFLQAKRSLEKVDGGSTESWRPEGGTSLKSKALAD